MHPAPPPGEPFAWDPAKAAHNFKKYGVHFEEARTVFADPGSLTVHDETHSHHEDRWFTLGLSAAGRLLAVAHTDREGRIRLISARPATRGEARDFASRGR